MKNDADDDEMTKRLNYWAISLTNSRNKGRQRMDFRINFLPFHFQRPFHPSQDNEHFFRVGNSPLKI